jgi:hypothetical protein
MGTTMTPRRAGLVKIGLGLGLTALGVIVTDWIYRHTRQQVYPLVVLPVVLVFAGWLELLTGWRTGDLAGRWDAAGPTGRLGMALLVVAASCLLIVLMVTVGLFALDHR